MTNTPRSQIGCRAGIFQHVSSPSCSFQCCEKFESASWGSRVWLNKASHDIRLQWGKWNLPQGGSLRRAMRQVTLNDQSPLRCNYMRKMISHMDRAQVYWCHFNTLPIRAEIIWALLRHRLHMARPMEASDEKSCRKALRWLILI